MRAAALFYALPFALVAHTAGGQNPIPDQPLNRAIAAMPANSDIWIAKTERAMDGGSILNEIRFADGQFYVLSLDFPIDLATDKVAHPELHFTVFASGAWQQRETLKDKGPAEKRLIQLLERLSASATDARQRKNATTLLRCLKDRKQPFPMGRKSWDFTPWSVQPTTR